MKRRFEPPRQPPATSRVVTSLTNPLVKDIRALGMRKVREEAGLFVAEGLKIVIDAIDRGWPIRRSWSIAAARTGRCCERAIAATRRAGGEVIEVTPTSSRRCRGATIRRR